MTWPAAEVFIHQGLVRDLVDTQFPQFEGLELTSIAEGFDNSLWRLGDNLVVRLPRRQMAVEPLENELRWLDAVAGHVSLRTPLPLRRGAPSERYAWPWLIGSWIDGVAGDELDLDACTGSANALASFERELHVVAPEDAPHNPYRSVTLFERTAAFEERLHDVARVVDVSTTRRLFQRGANAPRWSEPPRWIHGDLHPGNTVYRDGALVGVTDFGDLCAGDPATDLAGALLSLPFAALEQFFATYGLDDEATLRRTVGWATYFGVFMVSLGLASRLTYRAVGERALANAALVASHF